MDALSASRAWGRWWQGGLCLWPSAPQGSCMAPSNQAEVLPVSPCLLTVPAASRGTFHPADAPSTSSAALGSGCACGGFDRDPNMGAYKNVCSLLSRW